MCASATLRRDMMGGRVPAAGDDSLMSGQCLIFDLQWHLKCYVHRKPLKNNFRLAHFPQTDLLLLGKE